MTDIASLGRGGMIYCPLTFLFPPIVATTGAIAAILSGRLAARKWHKIPPFEIPVAKILFGAILRFSF
ncbi:MAG: hypothetical protein U9R43_04765 [Thermodesulfobacteriota bacterium]|nr:hypothetical protein [Thermodesulfobacteriota bacterium]